MCSGWKGKNMREMRKQPGGQDKGRARQNATVDYQSRSTRPSLLHQLLSQIWGKQLEEDDLELLDVSLYHLFHNLDLLVQEILPQLAEIAVQEEANTHYSYYGSRCRQTLRQHIWVWLSEMKNRLERIDPLCQISAITISHFLIAIDISRSTSMQKSHQQLLFARSYQLEQHVRPLTTDERMYYTQGLQIWQELNTPPHKIEAFEQLFSDLQGSRIYLREMDTALTKIYCSAQTIFTMTLHASKTTANPKEAIHLLLDLQQHIDILQLHIETFLTPLHTLIKQYEFLVELR
jgi:hypothetical protein